MKAELVLIASVLFGLVGFLIRLVATSRPIAFGERLKASQDLERSMDRVISRLEAESSKLDRIKVLLMKQSKRLSRRPKDAAAKTRVDDLIEAIDQIKAFPIRLNSIADADANLKSLARGRPLRALP